MGLLKLGKKLLKLAPVVGDLVDNRDSKDGGEKRMHWPKAASTIVRYIIVGVIIVYTTIAVLKDKPIDKDKIDLLKDNIELLEGLD